MPAGLQRLGGLWLFWVLLLPGVAGAAEFSAQMVLKDRGRTMPGKVYVKNGKMRQEFLDKEGQTVTIVRPDKKLIWVVFPQERLYVELPLKRRLPGQFLQMPPDALSKRCTGTETVNGYQTDRYDVLVPGGRAGWTRQTLWLSQKLGVPLKMVCVEVQFSLEYLNVKEGGVPDRLFEPPQGYKRTTRPAGIYIEE
jgi:outer membrane lipoprotein-sorting protein